MSSIQKLLSKYAGDAVFPSMQSSISQGTTQKTQPVTMSNVTSQRSSPPTNEFLSPHITGAYGTRTLGQEKGMVTAPMLPQPNATVTDGMVVSASDMGKIAALQALGFNKEANILSSGRNLLHGLTGKQISTGFAGGAAPAQSVFTSIPKDLMRQLPGKSEGPLPIETIKRMNERGHELSAERFAREYAGRNPIEMPTTFMRPETRAMAQDMMQQYAPQ